MPSRLWSFEVAFRRNPQQERQAVTLLATAFVVVAGASATAFMVLAVAEQATWTHWLVWGLLFGSVVALIVSMLQPREKQISWNKLGFLWGARDQTDPLATYKFRRRRSSNSGPTGTNVPPTLESVRESAESVVRWVPRGPAPEREPRPSSKKRSS
ncbi:hypothetical protein GC163_13790 [bacterium]|nr:hypothetical protein [bacterium]